MRSFIIGKDIVIKNVNILIYRGIGGEFIN